MASQRPRGGLSLGMLAIAILLLLVALFIIPYLFGPSFTLQDLYLVGGIFVFGFLALFMLRMRRSFALANPAPNKVFEIVKCRQCSFKQIKNFALGDYVTKTLGMCTQCNTSNLFIDGIYGEPPQRR
ncbi:MAG TPA: hypothetical protein VE955_09030 [Candidatus Dormibacteraeota bacterium]|nr:hypothetical protein [Candidatus Dormibacteraeota bacterium]